MGEYFTRDHLYRIRNEIPVISLIKYLNWPSKHRDGMFFFLCPSCNEFQVKKTPWENLGHCFSCERNFNTIDLVMAIEQVEFVVAIGLLEPLLPVRAP